MIYSKLGDTDIEISKICLGTMTFGEQNTEKEAHQQLDFALDNGVNFIDTAEMYPVPPKISLPITTPKAVATATIHKGIVGGKHRGIRKPVTKKPSFIS